MRREMDMRTIAEDRVDKLERELLEARLEAEQRRVTIKKERQIQEELQKLKIDEEQRGRERAETRVT